MATTRALAPSSRASGNMLAIVVATSGTILLWSAIKNIAVTVFIRDLVKGRNPNLDEGTGPNAVNKPTIAQEGSPLSVPPELIPSSGAGNNISGGKSGGLPSLFGITERQFQTLVLKGIGAPLTEQNYRFMSAWMHRENTAARYNPLATTQRVAGSYSLPGNSAGVQQYKTAGMGVIATVATLLNGYYKDVVAALRSGKPSLTAYYPGLKTWSGNGYVSVG